MLTRIIGTDWMDHLVEKEVLQKLLRSFSKSTGLKAVLVGLDGNTLITPDQEITDCRFCQMIRTDEAGTKKCQRSYARAGMEAAKYGEPYIFRCHAGLIAWAAPILLEEQHVGSIICGQVLMWEPEDYFLEEIEDMVRGLDVDVAAVKRAAAQLDVTSGDRVQAAADMLFVVANQIMKSGMTVLEQRRQIAAQQARLGEEIQARKSVEAAMRKIESRSLRIYSLDKEHDLAAMVRNGNNKEADKILDNLLSDIIEKHDDVDSVKTRVVELLVVVSRAAIDGGADLGEILKINSHYYNELLNKRDAEQICLWIKGVLQTYLEHITEAKDRKNLQVLQKAAEYMKQHYHEKLTIDDIAQAVYLSPCYLSRVFKQELGCTLMEYLTKVRVDHAKAMLKDPQYNVMQVANEIGFDDPSYFAKVFKKSEGVTPSQFRQKAL